MVSHPIKVEVPENLQALIPADKLAALVEALTCFTSRASFLKSPPAMITTWPWPTRCAIA